MRKSLTIVGLLLGTVMPVGAAFGQTKTGTTISQFLKIEPGARAAGMGNTGVALYDGIQSVYYNPAALGAVARSAVQFTHSDWYAGISYDYAAGALPVGGLGTIFASITSLGSGDIDVRTVDQPLGTGERYSVTDLALGLGYGRQLTSRFGVGVQFNYLTETIWHTSLNALTLSIGTAYLLSDNGVRIGASISNLGTTARYTGGDLAIQYDNDPGAHGDNSSLPANQSTDDFPVPILFRAGLSVPHRLSPDSKLLIQVDAFHPSDNTESMSGGVEWLLKDTLALRAGYQHLFEQDSDLGVTLGAGLQGGLGDLVFQFDYAWAEHSLLDDTHRVTFVINF
jgi:long-subunit fatty acid transport protein